ncbi:MAG: hypothetical protein V2A58_03355 [Planctomycetota bacterium]
MNRPTWGRPIWTIALAGALVGIWLAWGLAYSADKDFLKAGPAAQIGLLGKSFRHPVFILFLACIFAVLIGRFWIPRKLKDPALLDAAVLGEVAQCQTEPGCPDPPKRAPPWPWFLAGLAVFLGCAILLEKRQPFYFVEDDNFDQLLPQVIYGVRSVLAGELPQWNPYQYLGAPLAEVGTYTLTYPPTYLAYAVARYLLGSEYLLLDVFCWMHLAATFCVCFWLGRRLRVAAPLAAGMGLCVSLSGFALIAGRSWFPMTATMLWASLLAVSTVTFLRCRPRWAWTAGTGLAIGLYFHAGHVQLWLYCLGLLAACALWLCVVGAMRWRRLLEMLPALLLGIGIAAVLLVPQYLLTRNIIRIVWGNGILPALHALFLPYPLARAAHPQDWGTTDKQFMTQFYYSGSLFALAWLGAIVFASMRRGGFKKLLRNPFFFMSILALLMMLGYPGGLWPLQARLPLLNKFTMPWKFLPLFHVSATAAGALIIHRLLILLPAPKPWLKLCFPLVAALVIYHVNFARPSFFTFREQPYPALPPQIERLFANYPRPVRVLSITHPRCPDDNIVASLSHNYPTLYDVGSLLGYDTFVTAHPRFHKMLSHWSRDSIMGAQACGITHIVVHRTSAVLGFADPSIPPSEGPPLWLCVRSYCRTRRPVLADDLMWVFEVDDSAPFAFPAGDQKRALPVEILQGKVRIDTSGLQTTCDVVVNFLWWPNTRLRAHGLALASRPDPYERILVTVPAGTQDVIVSYESPWRLGGAIGGVLISMGCAAQFLLSRSARSQPSHDLPSRECN